MAPRSVDEDHWTREVRVVGVVVSDTVRLLYPDGTHRDVDPTEPLPLQSNDGDTVEREAYPVESWAMWRRHGTMYHVIAADWDAHDGQQCSAWVNVDVETYELEVARERAARIEAERQRDVAGAAVERRIANWLGEQADAVDAGQPGAREVAAELRRRAAEIRAGAYRALVEKN
jgi:hypothetical protein